MRLTPILFVLLVACARSDTQPGAVSMPRYESPLDSSEARWIRGMNYDPVDYALAWHHPDTLLVMHLEHYSMEDVAGSACPGSGFFAVPVGGGTARPLAVGNPVCQPGQPLGLVTVDQGGRWAIWSVRTEPNNSVLLRADLATGDIDTLPTGCRIYAEAPAFSPDGNVVAFKGLCESRDQSWGLYLVQADGSNLRLLWRDTVYGAAAPAWNPEGDELAYVRTRWTANRESVHVAVIDTAGQRQRVLIPGRQPAWSPSGEWIAYLSQAAADDPRARELRIIRPDGGGERLLFRNEVRTTFRRGWGPIPEGLPAGPLVWSPDSEWVFFTRAFDTGASVWRVSLETGEPTQVTRRQ